MKNKKKKMDFNKVYAQIPEKCGWDCGLCLDVSLFVYVAFQALPE